MQNPQVEFQQRYNKEIKEALSVVAFPADKIHHDFFKALSLSMAAESRVSLQIDWPSFKQLLQIRSDEPVNLYVMGNAINAIESKSVYVFANSGIDYISLMDSLNEMTELWNELSRPIQTRVQRDIAVKMKLAQPSGQQIGIGKA